MTGRWLCRRSNTTYTEAVSPLHVSISKPGTRKDSLTASSTWSFCCRLVSDYPARTMTAAEVRLSVFGTTLKLPDRQKMSMRNFFSSGQTPSQPANRLFTIEQPNYWLIVHEHPQFSHIVKIHSELPDAPHQCHDLPFHRTVNHLPFQKGTRIVRDWQFGGVLWLTDNSTDRRCTAGGTHNERPADVGHVWNMSENCMAHVWDSSWDASTQKHAHRIRWRPQLSESAGAEGARSWRRWERTTCRTPVFRVHVVSLP